MAARDPFGAVTQAVGAVLAILVTAVTAGFALLLLGASECGAQIYPPLWGILAILPAAAGAFAVTLPG